MGDDIRFHYAVAGIVGFSQCVRVRCNIGPYILHLCSLAVDNFLVIVHERVAVPMRGTPQLTPRISWRLEAGKKALAFRTGFPPNRDEPLKLAADSPNRMALRHQRGPAASESDVHRSTAACSIGDRLTLLHDLYCVPIPGEHFGKSSHLRNSRRIS